MRNYFTAPLVKAFKKTSARELQGIVYNLPGNHDCKTKEKRLCVMFLKAVKPKITEAHSHSSTLWT